MRSVWKRAARRAWLPVLLWATLVPAPARAQALVFEETVRYDVRIEIEPSGDLLVTETIDGPDLQGFADGTKPIPTPDEAREVVERKAQEAAASAREPDAPVIHPTPVRPVMPPAPPLPAD